MTETTSAAPVLETTVGGVLRAAAERAAERPALVEGTADRRTRRRWSYADLLADAERVARALLGRFDPGERVAVWAPNSPEWLLMEFGAALAGLTLVTVNPALRAGEVAHVLGQSRAQGVVLAPAYRGADLRPSDCPRSGPTTRRRSSTPPGPRASRRAPSCVTAGSPTTPGTARRSCRPARVRCGSTRCRYSTRPAACC